MSARDRRREIGRLLREQPVNVDELAAAFSVSASTIRRDLDTMARDGAVVRTYGGARVIAGSERTLRERESIAVEQKAAIGRFASALVPDGAVAVLDAGTTVGALARNLAHRDGLTVVTNGLTTTNVLEQSDGIDVIVVGGRLRHISSGFVGPFAERVMSDVSADVAFLGADAVSARYGLSEETPEQASLKRVMIERARDLYVLADASKLGLTSTHWWTRIERRWTLVTDDGATEDQLAPFLADDLVTVRTAPTEQPQRGR